jgi:hypothetical protein
MGSFNNTIIRRAAVVTIKLRNERGVIRTSDHPEAKKPEEQHYNAQHTQFLTGPNGKAIFLRARGQKACALRQGAHSSVVRHEPEIFPG